MLTKLKAWWEKRREEKKRKEEERRKRLESTSSPLIVHDYESPFMSPSSMSIFHNASATSSSYGGSYESGNRITSVDQVAPVYSSKEVSSS